MPSTIARHARRQAMIVLQTPRLTLRHLVPEDLGALHALYADPEIRRYYPGA